MARIIGFFNQASSMGKTTLTVNLGFHLSQRGNKVLVVDMDSHSWLTRLLSVEPNELKTSIFDALMAEKEPPIHKGIQGVDLIPANRELSALDANLSEEKNRQFRLQKVLKKIELEYDFILLDCPPNLALASVMCLVAATHVLVPIETTEKGVQGAKDFLVTFQNISQNLNPQLKIAGIIPTRYDSRKSIHKLKLKTIQNSFARAEIPVYPAIGFYTDFENAWDNAIPLASYNPRHMAVKPLEQIAQRLEVV